MSTVVAFLSPFLLKDVIDPNKAVLAPPDDPTGAGGGALGAGGGGGPGGAAGGAMGGGGGGTGTEGANGAAGAGVVPFDTGVGVEFGIEIVPSKFCKKVSYILTDS